MVTNDLEAIVSEWLQQCGACDWGLPMGCACSDRDYRPAMSSLVDEVERLRAEVDALPYCSRVYFTREKLRAEAAEAKVTRVEAALNDFRNHADWCQAVSHAGCCQGECDCHVSTFRAALNGPPELEYPDLAYAVQKGGPNLDGPTVLTDEPTGDAMRWTKDDDK